MSDFDPPKPDDPSPLQMKKDNEARELQNALAQTAAKLGMSIRVVADTSQWCFRIYGRLLCPSEHYCIDEKILWRHPVGGMAKGVADLLQQIVEELQLKLHNNMAEAMTKTDVRERQFRLTDEDKHTLHDMFNDACSHALRDYSRSVEGSKTVDKYQALLGRLFR